MGSGESATSSVNLLGEDVPLPVPPMVVGAGGGGGDMVVPKLGVGDAVKMPVRAAAPARGAPARPVH